jgi:tRNA(Ile)-lysidine synthase
MQSELTPNIVSSIAPLDDSTFAALLEPFATLPERLAIGVSGGPDSMALAYLTKVWADRNKRQILAFIVDHGLRAESASEAEATCALLHKMGISAEILHWQHPPIVSRLHITARKARLKLLTEACKRGEMKHLLLAHHRDDQAETILMRLAKGSGVDGLAGIAAHNVVNEITIFRPFLPIVKERLIATCITAKIPFVADASNNATRFARGRLRRVMPLLAEEGLSVERLVDLSARAAVVKDALEFYTQELLKKATSRDASGALHIDLNLFRTAPRAIGERALIACLQYIHTEDYAPEYASLSPLYDALVTKDAMPIRTLNGCMIGKKDTTCLITRELADIGALPIAPGETVIWDQHWAVTLSPTAPEAKYLIKLLGLPPRKLLDQIAPNLGRQHPVARARTALPALWIGEKLVSVPNFIPSGTTPIATARLVKNWPHAVN